MKRLNYKQISYLNPEWIQSQINKFVEEDAPFGDVTTEAINFKDSDVVSEIVALEPLTFCGQNIIPYCSPNSCKIKLLIKEGEKVFRGDTLAIINGPARDILTHERVTLNLIQRLCGISSETKKYTSLNLPKSFKVLDTRKMTPGLRKFEKYAVSVGGGWNHRLDLSSGILIKDNHIQAAGGIQLAVNHIISKNNRKLPVELEVDTIDQLSEALKLDLDGYLLDNMEPQEVQEAVNMIRNQPKGEIVFIEASGGVTYEKLELYAKTGIDGVSTSAITAKAPVVDIKLEFK